MSPTGDTMTEEFKDCKLVTRWSSFGLDYGCQMRGHRFNEFAEVFLRYGLRNI